MFTALARRAFAGASNTLLRGMCWRTLWTPNLCGLITMMAVLLQSTEKHRRGVCRERRKRSANEWWGRNRHVGIHRRRRGQCVGLVLKSKFGSAKNSWEPVSPLPGFGPRMSPFFFLHVSPPFPEKDQGKISLKQHKQPLDYCRRPGAPSHGNGINNTRKSVQQHKKYFEQHKAGPTRYILAGFATFVSEAELLV